MRATTLRRAWEFFERNVIPEDADAVQRQEMRRAFYAGAFWMLSMARDIGEDSVSEEQGVEILKAAYRECQNFIAMMNMGRA